MAHGDSVCIAVVNGVNMAVKVEAPKNPDRKFTFYLPVQDKHVVAMLEKRGHKLAKSSGNDFDILLLVGGVDIVPMLYGEGLHSTTHCNIKRDMDEIMLVRSLHHMRMKVGICRGAQLLNVLSGGRLWQHVNGHVCASGHMMKLYDDHQRQIHVSSRHHQMMIPGSEGWVLGTSMEATTFINETMGQNDLSSEQRKKIGWKDPEIVYYGSTHSLCFQPHPEDNDDECQDLFFNVINDFWDDKYHKQSLMGWEGE